MLETPKIGQVFQNRYLILSELGRGGAGLVYKAKQVDADREVAIKVLRLEKRGDSETVARFFREFRLLSTLTHPHIMTVYGVSLDSDSSPYAICEFVDGASLSRQVYAEERLDWKTIVQILLQISEACQYAHEQGVVHRDLKPDNILLQQKPQADFVKILDFGLSKVFIDAPPDAKLTMTGQLIGTPHYMSPEQAGMKADARTDIYALGCILFELLRGEHLFDADTSMGIIYRQINEDPQDRLVSIDGLVPEKLFSILSQLLEKDPEHRFASMADLSEELRALLSDPGKLITGADWKIISDKTKYRKKGLRTSLIIAAVVILVANCGFFLFFFLQSQKWNSTHSVVYSDVAANMHAEIRRLESKGDYAGAVEQYVTLLKTGTTQEFERCFQLSRAVDCVGAALYLKAPNGEDLNLAKNALFITDGAIECAVKRKQFAAFNRVVAIKYKALELLKRENENQNFWQDVCKQADSIWGNGSAAAVQLRYAASLAYMYSGKLDDAADMIQQCMKLIDSGSAVTKETLLSIKLSWVLILQKRGDEAEAIIRLKECDQDFLQAHDLRSQQRRILLERLLSCHAQLNQLESFEELLGEELKENPELYQSMVSAKSEAPSNQAPGRRPADIPALIRLFLAMKYSEKGKQIEAYSNYKIALDSFGMESKENAADRYYCLVRLRSTALLLGKKEEAVHYQESMSKMLIADPSLEKYTTVSPN